jgi:transcriptional regulator with XRE-family HTH domain
MMKRKRREIKGQIGLRTVYIASVRKAKDYTQSKLAKQLYISRGSLASYECGRRMTPKEIEDRIYMISKRKK